MKVTGVMTKEVEDMMKLRDELARKAGPHMRRTKPQLRPFSMEANLSMP